MAKREAGKPHGILYYIGMGLSVGLFVFVLLIGALAIVVPAATGSVPMTVLTPSMSPTYPPGTLIIVKPIDAKDIRIGDVVTYQIEPGQPTVVTHRVVSIISSTNGDVSFQTQGDANNTIDQAAVIPDQIKGTVWYSIPYLGFVNTAVNGEARGWLIPLIAIGLFLYVGYLAASGIVSKMRKGGKDDDAEENESAGARVSAGAASNSAVVPDATPAPVSRERGRRSARRH